MRQYIITLFLVSNFGLFSQDLNRRFVREDGYEYLLGEFTINELDKKPFKSWYKDQISNYQIDHKTIDLLKSRIIDIDSITIFIGTWCGDSKREVPRFVKILEALKYDLDKVKWIALNRGFQNYKQSPEGQEKGMNIHRVPTFIFHNDNGEEINRIVESPKISLEEDLISLLLHEYTPNYEVVMDLNKHFNETGGLRALKENLDDLIELYRHMIMNKYELNTYGYVLLTSFQIAQAELVFEINSMLFPSEASVLESLGEIKTMLGKRKEAQLAFRRSLSIDPENEAVRNALNKISLR